MTIPRRITTSILLRAAAAVTLLALLYLLALVLVLIVPALVIIVLAGVAHGAVSAWTLPSFLLLLVAAITLQVAILRGITARPADSRTRIPVPDDSELWPTVTELAKRTGTRPPNHLYLYIDATHARDVNAEVRENARCLGLLGWTRSMDIGLPLLATLSPDQLQAVLGHELGHYSRNDTRLLPLTRRGHITVKETLDQLDQIRKTRSPHLLRLLTTVFALFAVGYMRVSTAVARRQELHADAQAVQTVQETLLHRRAGPQRLQLTDAEARPAAAQVTAQALLLAHAVPEAWADFLTRYPTLRRQYGYSPGQLFTAFQRMVTDGGYQQDLARFQRSALARPAGRFDTHPSLRERLRYLGVDAADAISPPGWNPLLADLQPHLAQAAQDIHNTAAGPAATPDALRIDLDDWLPRFWHTLVVTMPIVVVLSIIGYFASITVQAMRCGPCATSITSLSGPQPFPTCPSPIPPCDTPITPNPVHPVNPVPATVFIPSPLPSLSPLPAVSFLTPVPTTGP